jgi:hypothetical protein
MNPSTEDWESHELDRLLFDYLEGNLTGEQAMELEQAMASDASLAGEMDHWKEAVVTQDFYDTSRLEQKLLLEEVIVPVQQQANSTTAASLFMIALLTCICSIWPVKVEKEAYLQPHPAMIQVPAAEKINGVLSPQVSLPVEQHPQQILVLAQAKIISPPTTAQRVTIYKTQTGDLAKLSPVELSMAVSKEIPLVAIPEGSRKKLSLKSVPAARTISRKQARQIARMKERALQRRMANEFLKGRVPYVVPLNTRNF